MSVVLRNKKAFIDVLDGYQPAPESIKVLADMPLVILLGVSGAGRNTIINELVASGKYKFIVSDTTRPPKVRDGKLEQDGVNYHFRPEEDVLEDLQAGKFLEAELIHNQQVSGINIRELENAKNSGKIPINEVDLGGTDAILRTKPDTKFFFVIPPSYDIWMKRLMGRENMKPDELHNRMQTAIKVLKKGLKDDHFIFVINDVSAESAKRIDKQVHSTKNETHHAEAAEIAAEILKEVKSRHSD